MYVLTLESVLFSAGEKLYASQVASEFINNVFVPNEPGDGMKPIIAWAAYFCVIG